MIKVYTRWKPPKHYNTNYIDWSGGLVSRLFNQFIRFCVIVYILHIYIQHVARTIYSSRKSRRLSHIRFCHITTTHCINEKLCYTQKQKYPRREKKKYKKNSRNTLFIYEIGTFAILSIWFSSWVLCVCMLMLFTQHMHVHDDFNLPT